MGGLWYCASVIGIYPRAHLPHTNEWLFAQTLFFTVGGMDKVADSSSHIDRVGMVV